MENNGINSQHGGQLRVRELLEEKVINPIAGLWLACHRELLVEGNGAVHSVRLGNN